MTEMNKGDTKIKDIQRQRFFEWMGNSLWIDAAKLKVFLQDGIEDSKARLREEDKMRYLDRVIDGISNKIMVDVLITLIDESLASQQDRLWKDEKPEPPLGHHITEGKDPKKGGEKRK